MCKSISNFINNFIMECNFKKAVPLFQEFIINNFIINLLHIKLKFIM